ncbi:MAG TPA: AI-2E family transporter [Gracilimonas sp.]|uniref:AI-2E family transporter n=1 Tax=Gracilimonas sp. TaxID=1974203 RepID=UPI002D844F09|nr:AI-2E family transporter [Gracilimonas sp.]
MEGNKKILFYSVSIITGIFFLVWGILEAQSVLAPLITAIILALVILPMALWMEKRLKRGISSLISTFTLFIISLGFVALLSYQMKVFIDSWPEIKKTMEPKIEQWKTFVTSNTFLNESDLPTGDSFALMEGESGEGESAGKATQIVSMFGRGTGYLGTYLLTFIYVFFILNYRHRFRTFLLRLFDDEKSDDVNQIVHESANVVQNYLVGKLILIGMLAATYSIGLGITGVSNFILISIVAALFSLIPYVGNIIGFGLAMAFGYLTSGEIGVLIGIVITFAVAQFLESYVLQPYVVGSKVDVHPFFVIFAVIVGSALWGIIGMILAIPVMGIITILFLHVPALEPFGYLFSNKKEDN